MKAQTNPEKQEHQDETREETRKTPSAQTEKLVFEGKGSYICSEVLFQITVKSTHFLGTILLLHSRLYIHY